MGGIVRVFPRQAPSFAILLSHALPTRRVDAWRKVLGGLRTAYQESVQLDKRSEASILVAICRDTWTRVPPPPRPQAVYVHPPAYRLPCLVLVVPRIFLVQHQSPRAASLFACRSCVSIAFSGGSLASNLVVSEAPSFKPRPPPARTSSLVDSRLPPS
ncbi:hypothetical protein F5X68DRAFT_2163 [Plectosphaerella plurivora]|uniref:Uncharacterized protein n=1 Tax=Plectosphaerella plurivora TaxID=936078 RepID=A0A9P9AI69_9PEZI|nr:hypothetical protein F5X68DRAFT_2163 [Plectosphaerella plurivora]